MRIRWTCPALKMHTRIQNTLSKLYEDTAVFFLETLSPGNRNDQSIAVVPQTLCEATFYHVFTLNYRYTLQPAERTRRRPWKRNSRLIHHSDYRESKHEFHYESFRLKRYYIYNYNASNREDSSVMTSRFMTRENVASKS